MAITLSTKLISTASISSCLGVGTMFIYDRLMPKTMVSSLKRAGYDVLFSDKDFQAIFFDRKDEVSKIRKDTSQSDIKEKEIKEKEIKEWCQDSSVISRPESQEYRIFCTSDGIKSVKGFLTKSHADDSWIEDKTQDQDKNYKNVFAVYKSTDEFINWINEEQKAEQVKKDSATSSTFSKLKTKCSEGLKKDWKDLSLDAMQKYHFYCRPLKNSTVGSLLESQGFEKAYENGSFTNIYDTWKDTKALNDIFQKHTTDKLVPTHDTKYKSWCQDMYSKQVGEWDYIYADAFTYVKAICFKKKISSTSLI